MPMQVGAAVLLEAMADLNEALLAAQRHWYLVYPFATVMAVLLAAAVLDAGYTALMDSNQDPDKQDARTCTARPCI